MTVEDQSVAAFDLPDLLSEKEAYLQCRIQGLEKECKNVMVSRKRLALKTREKDEEIKKLKEEIEKLKDRYVRPSVIQCECFEKDKIIKGLQEEMNTRKKNLEETTRLLEGLKDGSMYFDTFSKEIRQRPAILPPYYGFTAGLPSEETRKLMSEGEKNFLKKCYKEGKLYVRLRSPPPPIEESVLKQIEETRKLEDQQEKANSCCAERLRLDPVNITMNIGKEAASKQI